jgi:hypothetical protein
MHRVTKATSNKTRIICVLVPCLLSLAAANAAECKFEVQSVDTVTNAKVIKTEPEQLTHWFRELRRTITAFVSVHSDDGTRSLQLRVEYVRPIPVSAEAAVKNPLIILAGDELLIAMSDGAVLQLPALYSLEGKMLKDDPHPGWLTTIATIYYELSEDTADALMAQNAKALRITTDSAYHDVKIHKTNTDAIRRAVECIWQP